jgi:hypothetical protein
LFVAATHIILSRLYEHGYIGVGQSRFSQILLSSPLPAAAINNHQFSPNFCIASFSMSELDSDHKLALIIFIQLSVAKFIALISS